jgi:hypothetical protein
LQAEKVTAITHSVREISLAAVSAGEKTNVDLQKLIEKRTNILQELDQKYKLSTDAEA